MTGRRFGIVIGTNEYSDSKIEKLEFAEKDAKDIKSILKDSNICEFDEVIELINKSEKYTFDKIGEMFKRAEYEDLLLIYFSGHGQTDSENELCLLFNDTRSDNLIPTSLNFSMIRKCIDDSRCKTVVVILDCCYSGAADLKGNNLTKTLDNAAGSGIVILSSSRDYETSKEDKELKNGILTHYLIKGLKNEEIVSDSNGEISIADLYNYVYKKITERHKQTPCLKVKGEGKIIIGKNHSMDKENDKENNNIKEKINASNKQTVELITKKKRILILSFVLGVLLIGTSYILGSNSSPKTLSQLNDSTQLDSLNTSKPFTQDANIQKSYFQPVEYVSNDWENQLYYYIIFGKERYVPLKSDSKTKLAKFVLDNDDKFTLKTGETLDLGQGYTIKAKYVDVDAKEVWLEFSKGGKYIADKIISVDEDSGSTWDVRLNGIQGEDNILVFRIHVNQIFQGAIEGIAQIDGLWLIDFEDAFTIKPGEKIGGYEIVEIADDYISYKLPDSHTL